MLERIKSLIQKNFEPNYHYRGFLGKTPAEWTSRRFEATLTKSEKERAEKAFDPKTDGCIMDTIGRLYPEKVLK